MDDRKSQPTLFVFLLALLGFAAIPRWTPPEPPASNRASDAAEAKGAGRPDAAPTPRPPSDSSEDSDIQVLRPLIELADDGTGYRATEVRTDKEMRGSPPGSVVEGVVQRLKENREIGPIHGLIALLPDPVHSSGSQDFDSELDGIQRAMESAGFVLEGFRFPWADPSGHEDPPERRWRVDLGLASLSGDVPSPGLTAKISAEDPTKLPPIRDRKNQPGLMVFIEPKKPEGREEGRPPPRLVAVFIVRETPTLGLNKTEFVWSLDLVNAIADAEESDPRSIPILGPSFSGTAPSLREALRGWLKAQARDQPADIPDLNLPPRHFKVRIVAGGASELEASDFDTPPPDFMNAEITFHTAVHRSKHINDEIINYIINELCRPIRVAMLVESNTGYGRRLSGKFDINQINTNHSFSNINIKPKIFPFPIHIASLRASYERQGLLRDQSSQLLRSAGRLDLPAQADELANDLIPSLSPEFSTRVDELVMVQALTAIARGGYDAVGISATGSRDTIFLAQLVKKFLPDARLFTDRADLLFTQPQTISDLRGMLIGSTYPLYPPNRVWTDPAPDTHRPHIFFGSEPAQGIYNATMYQLARMFTKGDPILSRTQPLEFAAPFGAGSENKLHPPVWIGVVGNRGIYPLQASTVLEEESKGPTPWLDWSELPKPDEPAPILSPDQILSPPHPPIWRVMESIALLSILGLAVLAAGEFIWARANHAAGNGHRKQVRVDGKSLFGRLLPFFEMPARYLCWIREPSAPGSEMAKSRAEAPLLGPGPGWWLVLGHLGFFLLFAALNWPFLLRFTGAPESGEWVWPMLARLGFAILWVSLGISVVAAWRVRAALRRPGITVLVLAGAAALVYSAIWRFAPWGTDGRLVFARLALERILVVTSGVSPTLPVVFVGLATVSCLWTELRRRYLDLQIHVPAVKLTANPAGRSSSGLTVWNKLDEELASAGEFIRRFPRAFLPLRPVSAGFFPLYLGFFFVRALVPMVRETTREGWGFQIVFGMTFVLLVVYLVARVYYLTVAWGLLAGVLEKVGRLPTSRSFHRLPARVARWFFETPTPQNRSVAVELQAAALAARCTPSVRDALSTAFYLDLRSSDEWPRLVENLSRFDEDGGTGPNRRSHGQGASRREGARANASNPRLEADRPHGSDSPPPSAEVDLTLLKILTRIWEGAPLAWLFAEPKGKGTEEDTDVVTDGADWPIAPTAARLLHPREADSSAVAREHDGVSVATSRGRAPSTGSAADVDGPGTTLDVADLRPAVREWAEAAEDLVCLQLLHHLSQDLAHIRLMIGPVVFGLFALLLAVNSYPFPWQNQIQIFLVILIAAAVVAILRIVLGINRDETISRVANTLPGRLKLDRDLSSGLLFYILPLIGILAAVSYDISDLLRVLLDPLFRNF